MRRRTYGSLAAVAALAIVAVIAHVAWQGSPARAHFSKFANGDPDAAQTKISEGPIGGFDAYLAAAEAYPGNSVSPAMIQSAAATFDAIAAADAKKGDDDGGKKWDLVGPTESATQPGVLSFSGATNDTASRTTALAIDPDCKAKGSCRVWIGAAGGGVWRTESATRDRPDWKQVKPKELDQNSVGVLTLDPTDKKHDTIYLGTGEPNRCSSGCEAGVGVYMSNDKGEHWTKLAAACVSNPTYPCVNPGQNAFLGRGIRSVVVDPTNANHLYVGSALAVRGLSHVIGIGGGTRIEPLANLPGLYESTDGGATFTMVWDGAKPTPIPGFTGNASYGITDVELDPLNPAVVYVAAFDAGLWRRDAGATTFTQIFKPQFVPPQCTALPGSGTCGFIGQDRLMIAPTVKGGKTRIYLTEGTGNIPPTGFASTNSPYAANFWRIDNAGQSAAALLASQVAGSTAPDPATHTFPATYGGWQKLTATATGSPYFATDDFCTAQCWYDQNVYTPAGMPDTVYVIGSYSYGEVPCNTNGVGCGNGRSNGRAVIYSNTAGDPDAANNLRTFSDLTADSTENHPDWCAYAPYFDQGCVNAPNSIHPDQHVIGINPGNPTQIFEGSDGGLIRTSGQFADVSSQCDEPHRNGGGPLPSTTGSYLTCKRMLTRVPTLVEHINRNYSSTIQFINVAIRPDSDCEVTGGTQDNGTWSNQSFGEDADHCDHHDMTQIVYGDGGNAGYDGANSNWRFNEFTSGFSDSNFQNGDPEKWVITSAPLVNSGEPFAFYWPQIADPNPVPDSHPIFSGGKSVWRTWAFGAGTAGHVPQDKTPNIAAYETDCAEFVVFGGQDGCGDYRPLGGAYCDGLVPAPPAVDPIPPCTNAANDLTGTVYGADRLGGSISWLARNSFDHGTLWATTSAGRVFVTHTADAANPAAVTWHRVDSSTSGISPTRFPSGIYADPDDQSHAWISYSGFNALTPTTPGHVFDVREGAFSVPGSGVFRNLNVEAGTANFPTPAGNGDLPVSDVVRDDTTHTLYVSTDFGVLRGESNGLGGWHVTKGMPRYEVMHLEIQPSSRVPTCTSGKKCKRVLYAATHSQGIWKLKLH